MPALALALLLACTRSEPPAPQPVVPDSPTDSPAAAPRTRGVQVQVTLDGAPAAGVVLSQGGNDTRWTTDTAGEAWVELDLGVEGDLFILASHPEARIGGEWLLGDPPDTGQERVSIALTRYATGDNLLYVFQDPGEPTRQDSTNQCAHCHVTLNAAWFASPHRSAAKNPHVQDLYAGAAAALGDEPACTAAGGRWWPGLEPGTGASVARCYVGVGVLPDLNPTCGSTSACDGQAAAFGGCADCHAPGIDGALGGRDLLEATGFAYDYGVHCDVCHKVESVDLQAEAGVAGRLRILRPTEEEEAPLGPWQPLTFGPYEDVINPRMGSVARDLFHEATLCAGCHELHQPALIPGQALDPARWPAGRLPVHTTYSEWAASAFAPDVICSACHMPPDADVGNSADLGNEFDIPPGAAGGWYRAPGQVREHSWVGPRQPDAGMLALAAALGATSTVADGVLTVQVTVRNTGPGHALPTGEPLRALLLRVQAACEGQALTATGGPVVPDYGGAYAVRTAAEGWAQWPGAQVGQVIRVTRLSGGWVDYSGYGPFGDGTFSPADKGLAEELYVGEATITAVDAAGWVTLDAPLPAGDRAWLGDAGWPAAGGEPLAQAGAPGWGFARVLVDADGARMAPHHRAVDVASDNRLLPGAAFTTTHTFASPCAEPEVQASLWWRPLPLALAAERGWDVQDQPVAELGP